MPTLQATYLQSNNNSIQVQHRLPILPENIQTHIPFQIYVRMVDLLRAFYFRWVMRKVLINGEVKLERTAFVHALIGLDGECEVQDIVGVGEGCPHCFAQGAFEFCEICEGRYELVGDPCKHEGQREL